MESEGRVTIPDHVMFEVLDGEAVILNLNSGVYFTLDAVGTRVWELIQEYGDLGRVRRCMLDEFEVDDEVLDADIDRLLSELTAKGLIVTIRGSSR